MERAIAGNVKSPSRDLEVRAGPLTAIGALRISAHHWLCKGLQRTIHNHPPAADFCEFDLTFRGKSPELGISYTENIPSSPN
jgi:hypothetical protein